MTQKDVQHSIDWALQDADSGEPHPDSKLVHGPPAQLKSASERARRVRVERPGGDLVGRAVGIGDTGQLQIEDDHGDVLEVHVGDVVHLRDV